MLDQLNAWRQDLINLNRNNRLLYFRKTKSSTLELRQPIARDLLALLSKGLTFWEPPDDVTSAIQTEQESEKIGGSLVPHQEDVGASNRPLAPGQRRSRKSRSTSSGAEEIWCDVESREQLHKTLRWLERRAAQEFMDKGLWVLYLGIGLLDWIEQPLHTGPSETVSSPLVLIPVELRREGAQSPYQLFRADEDSAINPALAFKLQHDFDIVLPTFDDDDEENIDGFLKNVRSAVSAQQDWRVRDSVWLSVFSFHKEVMYRDLFNNEATISAHALVQALALGHREDKGLTFDPSPEHELDEKYPPEAMVTILDCDASQRQCLVAAAVGHSFVMDGPPGTGKSQTIANMIADALAHNKTVLFVSEKAAALEVVQQRLDHAGLSEYVLELHSHKATRKQVAQTLGRSLTRRLAPRNQLPEIELQRLIQHRRELTGYAQAMNERREPIGKSVHDVTGELSALQHLPQAPVCNGIDATLAAAEVARIYDSAEALSRSWEPVRRGDDFLWRNLIDASLTQARRASLVNTFERALSVLENLEGQTRVLADATGLSWRTAIADARRFHSLLALLAAPRNIPANWLSTESLQTVKGRMEILAPKLRVLKSLSSQLSSNAGTRWRELTAEDSAPLEDKWASVEKSSLTFLNANPTGTQALKLSTSLREAGALLRRGSEAAISLAAALGAPTPQTALELRRLQELGSLVISPHKPCSHWLDTANLPEVRAAVDVLRPCVASVKASLGAVAMLFNSSILEVDVEGLQLRFAQIHRGLRKLHPAYWRDRRVLREHSKSGKARKQEFEGLREAAECRKHRLELAVLESIYADVIGHTYYHSIESDFRALHAALEVAEAILRLAGGQISQAALSRSFSTDADHVDMVVRALSGMGRWTEQFAALSTDLGPTFEKAASDRPVLNFADGCDIAVGGFESIGEVLLRVARVAGANDVSLNEAREWLRTRAQIEEIERQFKKEAESDRELLGPKYAGWSTDFDALAEDLAWSQKIRDSLGSTVSNNVADRILRINSAEYLSFAQLLDVWGEIEQSILGNFQQEHRSEVRREFETPFNEVQSLLRAFVESIDDISEWSGYVAGIQRLRSCGLQDAVNFCIQTRVAKADLSAVLRRSVLESWLDAIRKSDDRLHMFMSKDRDHLVEVFRELDQRFIELAAATVIHTCNAKRPTLGAGAAGLIAAEANKQRRHMPIRRLIEQAAPVVQALKPCMMMSPLSVSQFLPPTMSFDLVIFDEASQVKPADAINCIYRARQLVISGDQKQLPPTPFFDRLDSDGSDEWEEEQLEQYESVLDVAKGSGAFRAMALRWHYRSQHEDLITYSNYSFYDGQLITFPGANNQAPDLGVELFVVPGIYRRGGARDNPIEATKVVERVLFHIREYPRLSIGVVAFSEAQASTIENEILRRADANPELRVMLDGDRLHGGFVKNLESVQGDERDIIIFSVGYGRDEAGRFTLNFGPLNTIGGHRRLNVAITRARRRIEVISSVEASDFVGELRSEGVRHLRRYLEFAARSDNRLAALGVDLSPAGRDSESPFEEEVARVIRAWGYDIVPQVGCADYRIDLAVKDPVHVGRYALGIECDGAMYHSSRVARDRDRLRQEVLARLGWRNLHRIWGLSWYSNRGQEEIRLRHAIDQAINGEFNATAAHAAPEPPQPDEVTVPLRDTPGWVVTYQVVTPYGPRTAAAMHEDVAQDDLQHMILEVVRGEGPVATEVVLRRVRQRWGMNRAGSRARIAFDTAVRALRRKGELASEAKDFLVVPDHSTRHVRGADATNPETIRTISEIPPSELKEAIVRFVKEVHLITDDELTARVAAVFGWNRRGADISNEFRKIVKNLTSEGVLKRNGDVLSVPREVQEA